jgi:hypothetical protein
MRLTVATPGTPGPPKFTNNDPIRFAGRLAGRRITDSEIVRPSGCDQFSGTATRAHCSPRGPSPQGFHVMGAAVAVAAQSNGTVPTASRARTARRHEGAGGASADTLRHYGSTHHKSKRESRSSPAITSVGATPAPRDPRIAQNPALAGVL